MKLNLGAGSTPLDGYLNLDIKDGQQAYPLAYPDNSADEIRASHVLEHFDYQTAIKALTDWKRVLKPGGWLKVAVPDFRAIAKGYLDGTEAYWPSFVMGGQQDANDYHRSLFDDELLRRFLTELGLQDVQKWTSDVQDCASLPVSLNLMAQKPAELVNLAAPMVKVTKDMSGKVGIALSMPAISHTSTWGCITNVAVEGRMPLVSGGGAFWHHSLTRSIEKLLEIPELEYILTVDYDSIFTIEHVKGLLRHILTNDDLDCVVPMQMKRETDGDLLVSTAGPVNMTQDLVPILTGHFGLTLFRRSFFERMPRPWFKEEPDADGRWSDGRTDADIAFWRQAQKARLGTALATDVKIGHLQRLVTWPVLESGKMGVVHQYLTKWEATRTAPEGV